MGGTGDTKAQVLSARGSLKTGEKTRKMGQVLTTTCVGRVLSPEDIWVVSDELSPK